MNKKISKSLAAYHRQPAPNMVKCEMIKFAFLNEENVFQNTVFLSFHVTHILYTSYCEHPHIPSSSFPTLKLLFLIL